MGTAGMTAGELRERIRFERRERQADDGYGNVIYGWTILAGPMAAQLSFTGGSEDELASRVQGIQPVGIRVRYSLASKGIMPSDRAVDVRSGKTYNVIAAANIDEHKAYIDIAAVAGTAE